MYSTTTAARGAIADPAPIANPTGPHTCGISDVDSEPRVQRRGGVHHVGQEALGGAARRITDPVTASGVLALAHFQGPGQRPVPTGDAGVLRRLRSGQASGRQSCRQQVREKGGPKGAFVGRAALHAGFVQA